LAIWTKVWHSCYYGPGWWNFLKAARKATSSFLV
jgi:hypothetical protein